MSEQIGGHAHTAPDAPTRPPRAISRKVGLPTGRAVVGALLVTVSVVGLFAAFRQSQADTGSEYVVVARTVAAGSIIEAADLSIAILDLGDLAPRTYTSIDQALGTVAIQTLTTGQLLQEDSVLTGAAQPGGTEISFAIDRSRALNGLIKPGEVVDVVATIDEGGQSCSTVVAANARVVSVRGANSEALAVSSRDLTITLSLDDDPSILGLIFAVDEAKVTLARATRAQSDPVEGLFCGRSAANDGGAPEEDPAS